MLLDLTPIIRKGVIDNTTQGLIRLMLWCGEDDIPLVMEMSGNCLRDIAGCRAVFRLLHEPTKESFLQVHLMEAARALRSPSGTLLAGDITLSSRRRLESRQGKLCNMLSIEFFLDAANRYIIETEDFECETGLPEWECSPAAESVQELVNMSALHDHVLANVAAYRGPALMLLGTAEMPACRWDYVLNRAEAYMIIASSIRHKYANHPRGLLAEAFVLDRTEILNMVANEEEKGKTLWSPQNRRAWEVLDFMDAQEAKLARSSMKHSLFSATANLSIIIQKHIIAELPNYEKKKEVGALLTGYSGIISHTLATIMLAREGLASPGAIISRAETLYERMQELLHYGEALHTHAREQFVKGAEALLAELKDFLYTLRQ